MIHEVKCYTASCDNCNKEFETSYSGFSIFNDDSILIEQVSSEDWHVEDDKHYCPECFYIDDEDNFYINSDRTKKAE